MDRDDLDFLISQYVDGTLRGGQLEAIEARLKLDPGARAVLAEYRALDAQLKALPRPEVRWDAFAEQISAVVAKADEPAQSYRLSDYRHLTRWVAVAAAVLIAAGTTFVALRNRTSQSPKSIAIVDPAQSTPPAVTVVALGPSEPDVAPSTAPVAVAIGPSDRLRDEGAVNRYAVELIGRPAQVLIASTARPAQDTGLSPF
jgi:anti-sigma factor RsiW